MLPGPSSWRSWPSISSDIRGHGAAGSGLLTAAGIFLVTGLVGYSTLYFGYHWPSDLVGGYLMALTAYALATKPSS